MRSGKGAWRIAAMAACVCVALACGGYLAWEAAGRVEAASASAAVLEVAEAKPAEVSGSPALSDGEWSWPIDENLLRRVDFDELKAANEDVAAWLWVPGTAIDGPVMQERTVGYWHYDMRDMYGNPNRCGSYLMPALPEGSTDGHTVVLGHLMGNAGGEWQFSNLRLRWGSAEGASEFPYVYLLWPDRCERWLVWAGCDAHAYDEVYDIGLGIGNDDYARFISRVSELARYETIPTPDRWREVLMLSTCQRFATGELGRFFIACVKDETFRYEGGVLVDEDAAHRQSMWRRSYDEAYAEAYEAALAAEEADRRAQEAASAADARGEALGAAQAAPEGSDGLPGPVEAGTEAVWP